MRSPTCAASDNRTHAKQAQRNTLLFWGLKVDLPQIMEEHFALLVGILLLQLVLCCSGADLKVEEGAKTGVDPKVLSTSKGSNSFDDKTVVSNLVSSGNEVQEVKKDKDQVGGSKDGVGNGKDKSGSNGEMGLK